MWSGLGLSQHGANQPDNHPNQSLHTWLHEEKSITKNSRKTRRVFLQPLFETKDRASTSRQSSRTKQRTEANKREPSNKPASAKHETRVFQQKIKAWKERVFVENLRTLLIRCSLLIEQQHKEECIQSRSLTEASSEINRQKSTWGWSRREELYLLVVHYRLNNKTRVVSGYLLIGFCNAPIPFPALHTQNKEWACLHITFACTTLIVHPNM